MAHDRFLENFVLGYYPKEKIAGARRMSFNRKKID